MGADALGQPERSVSPGRNRRFSQVPPKAAAAGPELVSGLPSGSKDEGIQRLDSSASRLEA